MNAEHPNHPFGPEPSCPDCNPAAGIETSRETRSTAPRRRRAGAGAPKRESAPRNLAPPSAEHTNVPGEFDSVRTRRITSNSRGPGQDAYVSIQVVRVIPCLKCGGIRKDLGGPHSPRYSAAHGRLVDCKGDPIPEVQHG